MVCLQLPQVQLELYFDVPTIFLLSSHQSLSCYVFTPSSQYIMYI